MAKPMLLLLLMICTYKAQSQNLLANGDFEDRNICLEFRSGCAPEAWFRVPLAAVTNSQGTAGFFGGNKYESLVMENTNRPLLARSFIYTRILCHLDSGQVYQFRASFNTGSYPFDHVDLILLPFEPNRNKQYLSLAKQKFSITSKQKMLDKPDSWMEYLVEFTANGSERYLILGNFAKEPLPIKRDPRMLPNIIYDIDDVSLVSANPTQPVCPEWKANKARLYMNNLRHTPNNFLDDEDSVKPVEIQEPAKAEPPPVAEIMKKPINDTLIIPDVLFRFNSSELNPQFAYRLDTLISKIKTRTFKSMEIIGHTDSLGTHAFNLNLSSRRANTVKDYLAHQLQYPPNSIITKGMAETVPVATNRTSMGRQMNRRVEIVLVR